MKLTIFILLISFGLSAQNIKVEFFDGKVMNFAKKNKDFTNTIIDTITNQTRLIKINSLDSIIEIGWEMSDPNTNPLFYANYKISKVFSTTSFNQTTKKDSKYISYQCFDEDNYPLLIMLSIDKSHCYFHYFWSSSENVYLKSEKITLSKITKNNFIDRKSN